MPAQMQSKFDSTCKHCGVTIKQGDTIQKVGDHWCKNSNCPNPPKDAVPRGDYQDKHAEIWEFAVQQAYKVLPESDKVGRNILAQVFYKKCFDYVIHSKQQ